MNNTEVRHQPNSEQHLLLAYVADLELEVDRLRKLTQFVQHETRQTVQQMQQLCGDALQSDESRPSLVAMGQVLRDFATLLGDVYEPTGYHPAHDQVVAIALRPLIEQVFRWQQRLLAAPQATLHLELLCEHVDWFPARLRHILDNLISNALRYRDPTKGEARVSLSMVRSSAGYEAAAFRTTGWACPGRSGPKPSSCITGPVRRALRGSGSGSPSSSYCWSKAVEV